MFTYKCSKTHLWASLIPKFSRGDTPGPLLKEGREQNGKEGKGGKGEEVVSWLSGGERWMFLCCANPQISSPHFTGRSPNTAASIAQLPLGSSRHDSTRSTCRASRDDCVERVEPCCSNTADDEQAIVFACTSLVVFMLLHTHKSYLFRQIK